MYFQVKYISIILACSCICPLKSQAQADKVPYIGFRISLLDFEVLQIRGKTVMLKCRFANTGRMEVGLKKNSTQTVFELDTINLPAILWGHESTLTSSAANHIPRLKPGEISAPIWLDVTSKEPANLQDALPNTCPDLILDTAYMVKYSAEEIVLKYDMRNIGSRAVEIAGKTLSFGLNVYFVGGAKLTRGAIPAANTTIQLGRETLSGWLNPQQKMQGELVINLKNRTKFAPNLLLELAPPPALSECDRTNNTRSIEIKY